ncbi:unnamed protein product [Peronospora belbahrii]|uniref:Uncharacterized protein n=1 Tax=Peronospora belbahrii TaxID=622444 RepID=A0ABN8CVL8_9STRA|nr:unnamed protein product [Peronospora belbahrii]
MVRPFRLNYAGKIQLIGFVFTGFNSKLQASAMTLGPRVVIMQFKDTDTSMSSRECVLDQPIETLVIHGDNMNNDDVSLRYRLVAWSEGSKTKSLLAIASSNQVEIWEVIVTSGISVILKGCVDIYDLQGISWSPCNDVLLAFSKTDIMLIDASQVVLSWREVYTDSDSTRRAWIYASCYRARHDVLHCFYWTTVESLLSESPQHDRIDANSHLKGIQDSVGPISAVARVSPTVCILTTDTRLVLGDITRAGFAIASESIKPDSSGTGTVSSLFVRPARSYCQDVQEYGLTSSSDIIDLTSMRVSTSSVQNPLLILNRVEDTTPRKNVPHVEPRSHLLIVEYKDRRWNISSILNLPYLTTPDVLFVQAMRVIIGSTLSARLLIVHMGISGRSEWTASLSGELELPPMHVCRGLYIAKKSSFVSVASTEKRKRGPFFHAVTNLEPLPVYLSKLKVPSHARFEPIVRDTSDMQQSTVLADNKATSSLDQNNCNSDENKDLLNLILVKVMAMQTQLNTRFDTVDTKLLQLTARVEQLERNGRTPDT